MRFAKVNFHHQAFVSVAAMIMQWALFVGAAAITYIGIALFAQLSGGSSATPWQAFFSAVRPMPLMVLIAANMFFGLAIYYGFAVTRYAVPISIAIGAITSFIYSVAVFGTSVTFMKVAGILLAVISVVLLGL